MKVHTIGAHRLQVRLLEYDFKINFCPGAGNSAADALSRKVSDRTECFISSMSDNSGDVIGCRNLILSSWIIGILF